jgi:hypothetical protein
MDILGELVSRQSRIRSVAGTDLNWLEASNTFKAYYMHRSRGAYEPMAKIPVIPPLNFPGPVFSYYGLALEV